MQGSARRQGTHHQAFLVALRAKRRQRHPADRGCRGDAGAGAGGEHGARSNVGMQQPAGNEVHPTGQSAVHQVGEPAAQDDLAHQDEQRDGNEVYVGIGLPGPVPHDVPDRVVREQIEQDERQRTQCAGYVHTREEHHGHEDKGEGNQH